MGRRRHGRPHRDHRPHRRDEPEYYDWMMDEDDYLVMEWMNENDYPVEEDWEPEMDEDWEDFNEDFEFDEDDWDIIDDDEEWEFDEDDWEGYQEDFGPPVVASGHRVDMTTRDKHHGGRHMKCRWGKYGGEGNDAEGRHGGRHHGRHHKRDPLHCAKKMIIMGAVSFIAINLIYLCVHKKSIRYRKRYERLSDIHNNAVDRNLNEEERNDLY